MNVLIEEIKFLIIKSLDLEDIGPEDIDTKDALFGDGLGLDSIDALELGVELQKRYQFKIDTESEEIREHFYSVETLAKYITSSRTQ